MIILLFCQIGNTAKPPDIPGFLSPEVHDLLSRCLQLEPDLRPSAADLLKHKVFDEFRSESQQQATDGIDLPSVTPLAMDGC